MKKQLQFSAVLFGLLTYASFTLANTLPGKGVKTQAVQSTIKEETFQTMIIDEALRQLGYDVQPIIKLEYKDGYAAVATGKATHSTTNWDPLQNHMYQAEGGAKVFARKGHYIKGAAQGYLIDKKTAETHGISNIAQLKDPEIAKLFDWNDDGRADMVGCQKGWSCAEVTQHHLDAYGLTNTIDFIQGEYATDILRTVKHFKQGKPVIYYTWTPYWLSGLLVPNKDVIWLEVPFSAHPQNLETKLANGKNYGFRINSQRIISNLDFANQNPAAAKLFELAQLPINDVSAQNKLIAEGEDSDQDIEMHAKQWIERNQKRFDFWLKKARAAAMQ